MRPRSHISTDWRLRTGPGQKMKATASIRGDLKGINGLCQKIPFSRFQVARREVVGTRSHRLDYPPRTPRTCHLPAISTSRSPISWNYNRDIRQHISTRLFSSGSVIMGQKITMRDYLGSKSSIACDTLNPDGMLCYFNTFPMYPGRSVSRIQWLIF